MEAVIATEAGNGQLQSGVWQTLRNVTGRTLSSRTLLGRFLFEEVELLQVLMERLGPGSAFVEQSWLLPEHMPNLLDIRRRGDHEAFEAELVNRLFEL